MDISVKNLGKDVKNEIEEALSLLNLSANDNGYELQLKQGDALNVKFDGKRVVITYSKKSEIFRGLTILSQNKEKTSFDVTQKCTADELGVMLDCSRNAVRNVAHLKKFIKVLALFGYNQLQLYMEDTYEVDNEPYFGYMRGRYTQKELKEIDDYAYGFGIEIVPCIQTLAHLNQIFTWPEYAPIKDADDILLIGEERTYKLIDNMLSTVKKCFRSNKIHIGMDEAGMVARGQYADIHGFSESPSEVMLKHLNRVVEACKKYGLQPMMWSDMFFLLAFHMYYVGKEAEIPQDVKAKIPDGLRLVYWDYYSTTYDMYDNMMKKHIGFGKDVVFAGGAWSWMGVTPCNRFSIDATELALKACKDNGIKSIVMTMWGDNGGECADFALLPTLCMASSRAYGQENYKETFLAVTGITFDDFMTVDDANITNQRKLSNVNNVSRYMLFNDCIGGLYDVVADKDAPQKYDEVIKNLRRVKSLAGDYSYLFDTQEKLCKVLKIKHLLGVKTREAYKNKDKNEIKKLVKESYKPLIKLLEDYYEAIKTQWGTDNKPNGFEVVDYRLGGLILRVKHCAERLTDYANGKGELSELDEKQLNPFDYLTNEEKRTSYSNVFKTMFTTSVI